MIFTFGSDIGGRSNNEDSFYIPKEGSQFQNVIIVADGMGGYNAGEIASKTAVESAIDYMSSFGGDLSQNCVRSAIRAANNKIISLSNNNSKLKGMGTTMTVAAFRNGSVVIGHVGDSRAYLISKKNNTIKQITKDHSLIQMLLDSGEITLEEAYQHPRKNVITRALGYDRRVKIDTFEISIEPDDVVVVCSDGLARFVDDDEILRHITEDFYEGVEKLVTLVKERGGDDNMTVVAACNKDIVFDNRYKVIRQIGSGGMSKVYCAIDTKNDNKYVSVKLLKDEFYKDEAMREMFVREGDIATKLKHKNIINAQRVVEEDGRIYIVFDFVEGENLKDYIEKHGPMQEDEAIAVGMQVARALRFAHNNGYIHKDVKPQNIIIDENKDAFLTDFGLATKGYENPVRDDDVVLGSVYYFSPEHAKGEAVNMRSDIYSLGIVMYELLCGRLPFEGENTHEVIMGHLHKEPVPPNEVNKNISNGISEVILKAINKDCELRYVNFNSFMADMRRAVKHPQGGFVEYNPVPVTKEVNNFSLNRLIIGAIVIMSMFGLLFFIGYTAFKDDDAPKGFGMPNLVNMSLNDAENVLDDMGIAYQIEYYDDDNVESGVVINQSVRENIPVGRDTVVVLGVSINSKDAQMNDLFRLGRDDAVAYLNSANITDISFEYVDSELPRDFVVAQDPKSGTVLSGVKSVKLYLSNNETKINVPDLLGMDALKAKELAESKGFTIGIVYEEKNKEQKISRQLPVGGMAEYDDLSIDVWIGERKNKTVQFNHDVDLVIKEDSTKVVVCYEDDDGLLYYVNEFTYNKGVVKSNISFFAPTDKPKKIYIFYNNVRQRVIENVGAVK